jgi:molybdenum cofactor cytidylyltransferase
MGCAKALLPIGDTSFVRRIATSLRTGGAASVTVVVGRHAAEIRAHLDETDLRVIEHAGWATGRTGSLQAGLSALPRDAPGVLLAPTDMPWFRADTIRALLTAFHGHPEADFCAPRHGDRHGHPIALRRTLFDDIAALGPDAPLRELLRTRCRVSVDVDDPGVLHDANSPEDLVQDPEVPGWGFRADC